MSLLLLLVLVAPASAGCGDDDGEQTLSLTDRDARFLVEPGDVFTVVLESNPSTGYGWELFESLPRDVLRLTDDENAVGVGEVLADRPSGEIIVRGLLFDDGSGLVMCEVLAESFPPQCPGESLAIANPDDVDADFTEAGGVRWTDRVVVLMGKLENDLFRVTGS